MKSGWSVPSKKSSLESRVGIGELAQIKAGNGVRTGNGGLVGGGVESTLPERASDSPGGVAESWRGERGTEGEGLRDGVETTQDESRGVEGGVLRSRDGGACGGGGCGGGRGEQFGEGGAKVLRGCGDRGAELGRGDGVELAGDPGLSLSGHQACDTSEVRGKFEGGEDGGQSAVAVDGIREVLGRDEEIEPDEGEARSADGAGEVSAGGTVELSWAQARGGGVEHHGRWSESTRRGDPCEAPTRRGVRVVTRRELEAGQRDRDGEHGEL